MPFFQGNRGTSSEIWGTGEHKVLRANDIKYCQNFFLKRHRKLKSKNYCDAPKIFDISILANSADPVRSRQNWITVNKQIQFRQLPEEPLELDPQS